MRQDLYGAMKNALARGQSLDSVVTSFIGAGYDKQEVLEVAAYFKQGALSTTEQQVEQVPQTQKVQPPQQQASTQAQSLSVAKEQARPQQTAQQSTTSAQPQKKQYWDPEKYAAWYYKQPPGSLYPGKYMNPEQYAQWYAQYQRQQGVQVRSAAQQLPQASSLATSKKPLSSPIADSAQKKALKKSDELFPNQAKKRKRAATIKIVILIFILVILLGLLGASLIFKNAIIEFINSVL